MTKALFLVRGSVLGCLLLAQSLAAQSLPRSVSVASRSPVGYEPYTYNLGGFNLSPAVVAGVFTTDNFRARRIDRQGDTFATVQPEVRLASNWTRNQVSGRAYFNHSFHAELPEEDVSTYGAQASGLFEYSGDTQFRFNISADELVESRTDLGSFQGLTVPVRFQAFRGSIGANQRIGQVTLNGSFDTNNRNYADVETDGLMVDQDYRDVRTTSGTATAEYAIRPGLGLILRGQLNKNSYKFGVGDPGFDPQVSIVRDGSGYTAEGGVSIEITSLISANIRAGLINSSYKDPRLLDFTGLSYSADVLWNVTQLTSVRLLAARSVDATSSSTVAGNVRNAFTLGVDHELFRYILISPVVTYSSFTPNGTGNGGNELEANLTARYLVNRHITAIGRVSYSQRASSNTLIEYHASTANLSIRYAF